MTFPSAQASIKALTSSHTTKRMGEAQTRSPDPACMTALGKKQRRGREALSAKYFLLCTSFSCGPTTPLCDFGFHEPCGQSSFRRKPNAQGCCSQCPWTFLFALGRRVTTSKSRLARLSAELVVFNKPTCT